MEGKRRNSKGKHMTDKPKDSQILEDGEIVKLYWDRQERAISATDEKYGRYLFTIAVNILRDEYDSEDAVRDTYVKTWNRIPPTKPNILPAFLSKITRDEALDRYRAKNADKRVPSELVTSLEELDECFGARDEVENTVLIREVARIVNDFVSKLSERSEFIFVCRYYYSDKIALISDMAGVSEATVLRELAAIRKGLRACLEKEGYTV